MIVLADHHKRDRDRYGAALETLGHQVMTLENGQDMLRFLDANDAELVLLEVTLPGLDGIEVCKKARSLQHMAPVLFITQHSSIEYLQACLDAGGDDFIVKTDDIDAFIERISYWLRGDARMQADRKRAKALQEVKKIMQERFGENNDSREAVFLNVSRAQSGMLRFVERARDAAGSDFGHDVREKLYLLGYAGGVVDFWVTERRAIEDQYFHCLRAIVVDANILAEQEVDEFFQSWSQLCTSPDFRRAFDDGRKECGDAHRQGSDFTFKALARFAEQG